MLLMKCDEQFVLLPNFYASLGPIVQNPQKFGRNLAPQELGRDRRSTPVAPQERWYRRSTQGYIGASGN